MLKSKLLCFIGCLGFFSLSLMVQGCGDPKLSYQTVKVSDNKILAVTFSADSSKVAVADQGGAISLINAATGEVSGRFQMTQPPDQLQALALGDLYLRFSKDGQTLFVCGDFLTDASQHIHQFQSSGWDLQGAPSASTAPSFQRFVQGCSPAWMGGDHYLSYSIPATVVFLRDLRTDQETAHVDIDPNTDGDFLGASIIADRYLVLSLSQKDQGEYIQIWDTQTRLKIWSSSNDWLHAISPAGDRLLLSQKMPGQPVLPVSKFVLWGVAEGKPLQLFNVPAELTGTLLSIEFSEDQSRLVVASTTLADQRAYFGVWSLDQSNPITTYVDTNSHDVNSFQARFVPSRNDRLLTWYQSSSSDQLWEIPSGKVLDTIYALEGTTSQGLLLLGNVQLISISPGGDQLAGPSSVPGNVYFWDISGF